MKLPGAGAPFAGRKWSQKLRPKTIKARPRRSAAIQGVFFIAKAG
jgi:hypothetical protein